MNATTDSRTAAYACYSTFETDIYDSPGFDLFDADDQHLEWMPFDGDWEAFDPDAELHAAGFRVTDEYPHACAGYDLVHVEAL